MLLSYSSPAHTSIDSGSALSFRSFSKIQMTPSSFSPRRALAYHQKADQDRVTHAYTIGQEMTVSKSTVKASLINVGMMKAKLSLKGILYQWHLNCLCWDRSQKSRTLSNMQWRISHCSDFLSRVFIQSAETSSFIKPSLQRSSSPLTHTTFSLISIWPCSASYRSFPELHPSDDHYWRCCCCPIVALQTHKWKIVLIYNLKAAGTSRALIDQP